MIVMNISISKVIIPMWQQQVFALDAKYNCRRAGNQSNLGLLYIRRRSQLLREKESRNSSIRASYVKVRGEILKLRYGAIVPDNNISGSRTSTNDGEIREPAGKLTSRKSTAESFAFTGIHFFYQHTAGVTALKFANNDRCKLCCASIDGTISICSVTEMPSPPQVVAKLEGHKKGVTAIDWSISNDLIVSSSLDATVRLWGVGHADDAAPACLRVVNDQFRCDVLCCAFVPANNNLVVTGNSQGFLQILNISTGIYPRGGTTKIGGKVLSLACEENGGSLIWAGNDRGSITTLRLESSGRLSKIRRIETIGSGAVTSLSWRPWLSRQSPWPAILVSSAYNTISLYRIGDNQGSLIIWRKYPVKHRQYLVRSTFCPQMGACLIASGSEDGSVHLLDTAREGKAAQVNRLHGHSAPVLSIAFNYDESYLVTGDQQGLVIIWQN